MKEIEKDVSQPEISQMKELDNIYYQSKNTRRGEKGAEQDFEELFEDQSKNPFADPYTVKKSRVMKH